MKNRFDLNRKGRKILRKLLISLTLGASLTLAPVIAFAQDIYLGVRPNLSSLPFMVLQAKADDFLPADMNIILKPVPKKSDLIKKH